MQSEAQSRLARLLDYLKADSGNTRLLGDALALAIECGDPSSSLEVVGYLEAGEIAEPQLLAQATYLLLRLGRYAQAAEYGERAIAAGVKHPAVIFNTAFGHFYNDAFEAASALLEPLTASPECPIAALMLHVRALDHQERNEEAEPLALRAVALEPENPEALGLLALQQFENDDNLAAIRTAQEALSRDPDQLDALIACASAHFEQGSSEASRKTWMHTVEVYPECGRAWAGLGQIEFNDLNFDLAVGHLHRAVRFMPDHIGTWHVLAWIHILRGESEPARAALQHAYVLDRNYSETHGALAACDALDGKPDEARQGIRRAFRLNPDCRAACYTQMLLLTQEGKPEEGKKLFREMLARTAPSGAATGLEMVDKWLAAHQGQPQKAPPGHH
ncbi:tetratricopeptide repeat protein [Pseudomonas sp. CAU 1711]|uniref:tetratricopeptide repeat protein n=1 Tax=Pseudomonas sp. CAU 1711 TaxID=3140356 RepID=UPI003261B630